MSSSDSYKNGFASEVIANFCMFDSRERGYGMAPISFGTMNQWLLAFWPLLEWEIPQSQSPSSDW